ncbi:MAG TPA: ABC transporter ATP-binding protein [Desulfocapsa sulfexigens]|nr:ABC transporter ATP-binding protein [Desulfocapsa sulfexigens]
MIALVDVCKSFNGHLVLSKMSLEVQKNEVAGLLGRSGCGKSTILKLVAGLIRPDSGGVKVSSKKIGYIFQEHRLIPWKTALENVCFSLKASGYANGESRETAAEYIQKMGLAGFEDHYPAQLSGGMCQRVSIARAFAVKPDILLMDEPFSALDLELKDVLLSIVHEMLTDHHSMTALYVTHNPEELKKIAHKIYTLSGKGRVEETTI